MKKQIVILNLSILFILLGACKKEIRDIDAVEETTAGSNNGNPEAGFATNDMVMYWNEKAATILSVHTNPGADARLFAIIQIAVHDALNSIKPKYERYALFEREGHADADAAVASAAYWAIKGLNIQKTFPIDTWYNESLATIPEGNEKESGKILGKSSAEAILARRVNDGLQQVITTSLLPADGDEPGEYRSTLPVSNPALNLPHLRNIPNWGIVMKPFILQSNYQFRPAGPYLVNTPEYTADYTEAKEKGAMIGSTRTEEEDLLNRFWADLRHHIVWNNFTRQIIATKNMDAWKTACLFALIHTAMADGASSMLEAKFHFYYWRPETAIRIAEDGNPNTTSDPTWLPSILLRPNPNPLMNFYTPGVPEYPSGFGVLGGITGRICQLFFESDRISIDITSANLPGVTLHYTSISNAVRDNSVSKIFSGWYFRKATSDGENMGMQIADYVFAHAFTEE